MFSLFFFPIMVFFQRYWQFTGQQRKEGDHLLFHSSTFTRSRTLRHLQLCMWVDYHVFLIATFVFTRLLLGEIYHLIELPFKWLIDDAMFVWLLDELILAFCYSDFTLETGGFELASTITLVLQGEVVSRILHLASVELRHALSSNSFHIKVTVITCRWQN